ncbi:MAG: hypothetical protein IPK83_15060 [Planctomycetes bacterium]|nr:hypothetical protein [Planctomycetota bacterium]
MIIAGQFEAICRKFPVGATLLTFAMLGTPACSDDRSKSKIQPARTFAAPAKAVENAKHMSRPIGCNGNPYYYDNETQQWYYYTIDGKTSLSPNQPPCFGADVILGKQNLEQHVSGKNDASGDE